MVIPLLLQFILGDPRSGKETVSASLRGAETKDSPWTGLGYQYFNVKDPQDQGSDPFGFSRRKYGATFLTQQH